jgi:septal ring factor EnvC (AmiA/AmiB activator)
MPRTGAHIVTIAGAAVLAVAALFAQSGIKKGQGELAKIKETIKRSQVKIKQLEGEAQRSQAAIRETRQRAAQLDSSVTSLQTQEQMIAEQMIDLRRSRDSLNDELAILTDDYVRMARALFKQRLLTPAASILLMPKEHQMLALKQKLFERYARSQRRQAMRIGMMTATLAGQDSMLAEQQQRQMGVIGQKRGEIDRLMTIQRQHAQMLTKAESEKSSLQALVARKNQEAVQIQSMITKLIAEEQRSLQAERDRRRRAEEARARLRAKTSTPSSSGAVAARSARAPHAEAEDDEPVEESPSPERSHAPSFRWPTSSHRITEGYGQRLNRETNTVTVNPGINIAAAKGTVVKAAEDGTVSLVSWLPSYGTIVIVEHGDGYRTVYANLAAAYVSRGTDVRAGQRIGAVGESTDGEFLHFEVWKEQNRMNPVTVLP